jgi:polyphosphate kinase
MDKRVEILFPIFAGPLKKRIKSALALELSDNVKAREQDENGVYHYVCQTAEHRINCQLTLFALAYHVKEDEE